MIVTFIQFFCDENVIGPCILQVFSFILVI